MKRILSFTLLIILLTTTMFAQTKKFGDVSVEDFTAYNTSYDSSASAVVLFEKGFVEFDSDYNCVLSYHKRIKIITDDGFEYGDVEIPIFKPADQSVSSIKATTYILKEDGSIEENKVGRRDIFTSKEGDEYEVKKFTMPGLNKGVIIEYSYKKIMGNPFYMPDWKFHEYIPVEWSEIEMIVPASLDYQMVFRGMSDTLHINEIKRVARSVNNVRAQSIRLAKKDLAPVEDLPYLINRDDHISEVITQLNSVNLPGGTRDSFFKSWSKIAEELNERGDFGKQRLDGNIRDLLASILEEGMDEMNKVEAIYGYLTNNIEWDGYHRLITEKGIRDTFKEKKGNTADINLLLVEMLKEAGLNASPALISTRSNGTVLTDYSLINQFNMVVAVVELESSAFIVDASSGLRSYTFPHPKLLYRNALVIRDDNSYGWLLSYPIENTSERLSMSYSLKDTSHITVEISARTKGAFSEQLRTEVDRLNFTSYWEEKYDELEDLSVDSASFDNLQSQTESVTYNVALSFKMEEEMSLDNDIIYLDPFLFLSEPESPFKKADRKFPVEFSFPYNSQHMVRVELPEGYVVEEIPETIQITLPNQGGYYRFMSSVTGNTLTFVSTTNLAAYYYPKEEYQDVKKLFEAKYQATNGLVVLKKEGSE